MQKIKMDKKENVINELKTLSEGHNNVSKQLIEKLKVSGFELICLGTGKQSHTSSMGIQVWYLHNTYNIGIFVGIGTAAKKFGRGNKYYAWVK